MTLTNPRRLVAGAAATAVALTLGLAATASSNAPDQRSGADAKKAYTALAKKKDYVKVDLLAINDFHGQLEVVPSSSSSGQINNTPGGRRCLPRRAAELRAQEVQGRGRHADHGGRR